MGQPKGTQPIVVTVNRSQSRAMLMAIKHALDDRLRWPKGPDRAALSVAKRILMAARDATHEVA